MIYLGITIAFLFPRKYRLVSPLGQIIDEITDKISIFSTLQYPPKLVTAELLFIN